VDLTICGSFDGKEAHFRKSLNERCLHAVRLY
jgi:hypothetical protein